MTLTQLLFPAVAGLRVERVWHEGDQLQVVATSTRRRARCPCCGRRSRRVHSRYERTLADVPCAGTAVRVHLHPRRFWCRVRWCRQRIFCERLPELLTPWARRTARLQDHFRQAALQVGGEPAARHAAAEGTPVSARTLLRLVRATPLPPVDRVRVLGVDDWSRRKGHAFGTILVDLESHQVLDLLPDRTAATLASWLREHPEIEIVSRDRASAYADGVRQGAPQAVQVADRFHVLKNLTEALERMLTRHHVVLRAAAGAVAVGTASNAVATDAPAPAGAGDALPPPTTPAVAASADEALAALAPPAPTREGHARPGTRAQQAQQARRECRQARYQEVVALHDQGHSQVGIAATLGMSRKTVRRVLRADGLLERLPTPPRARTLDPYLRYLRERWAAGCDNALQLWRELQAQGYAGAASTVRQFLARWRAQPSRPGTKGPRPSTGHGGTEPTAGSAAPASAPLPVPPPTSHTYTARQTAWLLIKDEATLTEAEQAYVTQLQGRCPALATLQRLAHAFYTLVRTHDVAALGRWLAEAAQSEVPELGGFAAGLQADRAAVEAGITLPWSQGQVEGQVNRLKTLKRAMYGRATFELLRIRLLCAA